MIVKYSTRNLIYLSLFSSTFFVLKYFKGNYFKDISIPLISYLQNDRYITTSMKYISYLGSDSFRLFLISLVIVIGNKFQVFLTLLLNSFLTLLINFLKINFGENRPYWTNKEIYGFTCEIDFAFASGNLIISFPFLLLVFEIIFYRLELNFLINSNIFYSIGKSICFLICSSIGFSKLVMGVIYLDQFIEGIYLGLLFWFFFKNFLDLDELKLYLEVYIVYNNKKRALFIFSYFLLYFLFLLNFILLNKFGNIEQNENIIFINTKICGFLNFPFSALFFSLLDSAKYFTFMAFALYNIFDKDEKKMEVISRCFKINENNKEIFYDLCAIFYLSIKDKIKSLNENSNNINNNSNNNFNNSSRD